MSAAARRAVLLGLHQQFGREGGRSNAAPPIWSTMLVPFSDEYPDEVSQRKLLKQMAPFSRSRVC
jgi:hypothetical protein